MFSWDHYHRLRCVPVTWTAVVSHSKLVFPCYVQLLLLWGEYGPILRRLHVKNGLMIFHSSLLCATLSLNKNVLPYSMMSIGHGADPGFLAVIPQVTLVVNPVAGCRYFPPGLQLLSQPKRSPPWPVPNYTVWWQRHTGVSSLPKTTTQWCPARTSTRDLWIGSLLPGHWQ